MLLLLCASVLLPRVEAARATTTAQALEKLAENQQVLEKRLETLQAGFDQFVKTNAGPILAQIAALAQRAANDYANYASSLEQSGRVDTARVAAVRESVLSLSNKLSDFQAELLQAIRTLVITNTLAPVDKGRLQNLEAHSARLSASLQAVARQLQAVQATLNGIESRAKPPPPVLPSLWGSSVGLFVVGLAMAFYLRSHTAGVGRGLSDVLHHKSQWLATVIREVVSSHRAEMTDHINSLKGHLDNTVSKYEKTLRDLQDQTAEKLGELNLRLGNTQEEISSAIKIYARELTGERLEAELNRATELWKERFNHTLIQERDLGESCLKQMRERADGELRGILSQELRQAQVEIRGLADRVQQQIHESLRVELEPLRLRVDARAQGMNQREQEFLNLIWPPFFQTGPLVPWRERIIERGVQHDHAAIALALALGRYNAASRDSSDLRHVAEALHAVSLDAYRFWRHNGTRVLEASEEWKSAFQSALDASNTPLDIILVIEGERFDVNSMLAADSGSANRILVRDVHSWIVRDKSGPNPKVLCHGRVTTG